MPLWKLDNGIHSGKVIKPHSYLGYIKVAFFVSGLEETLLEKDFIFIEWNEKPVPYQIEDIQWRDDKTANVKLADINSEEEAAKLTGRNIVLAQEHLDEEAQTELSGVGIIGYKVEDAELGSLGEVIDFYEQGPQSLLAVNYQERELLIPVHEDIIIQIDHKKKLISVELPKGLAEI